MVSLVNFKSVDEDFVARRQEVDQQHAAYVNHGYYSPNNNNNNNEENNVTNRTQIEAATSDKTISKQNNLQRMISLNNNEKAQDDDDDDDRREDMNDNKNVNAQTEQKAATTSASFVVKWRQLKFCIEPKWHQRLNSLLNRSASNQAGVSSAVSASSGQPYDSMAAIAATTEEGNQQPRHQQHQWQASTEISNQQSVVTKIVLDKLDGSFKSGQLTAILGPSGAGKTTLLDCLTGHRKNGLTGSIKISYSKTKPPSSSSFCSSSSSSLSWASSASSWNSDNVNRDVTTHRNNLKVSIIPQNDHLMGHLTVYETLTYASKMKNCFQVNFNHKANIKRIAQQLGLLSCLNNRINKLSGGQYKRVSIAQELLSSPDILILDEPTSGLDAMTCYQTIQVLRRLTDQRESSKQIAVILTIHQPNSDVFQQFNHVYVVGLRGKCIYEGSPSGIESVINRIGLRLPNSYYNPATMIVEIAAGKYGMDSIYKLNEIQKKQHTDFDKQQQQLQHKKHLQQQQQQQQQQRNGLVPDEQTSTGDSAVDCPTSSSSSSSFSAGSFSNSDDCSCDEDDQDEDQDEDDEDADDYEDGSHDHHHHNNDSNDYRECHSKRCKQDSNDNENNNSVNTAAAAAAAVNTGFVMDNGDNVVVMMAPKMHPADEGADLHRKKRRRTRKRSSDLKDIDGKQKMVAANTILCPRFSTISHFKNGGPDGGDDDGSSSNGCCNNNNNNNNKRRQSEKRVKLNSLKADQKFPFWRHTYLHFHRSWLSIIRDPMLCSMQLALHIIVPVMVSLVYGSHVGKPNACPRAGPMDIMAYALEPEDSALQLQEDLRTTLENIGYIFFKLYGIIFAAMTVTVLTFPLDMHVLVKEFRNGWYGLSSYFLGRTLADIPFQLTLPFLAMSLSYYATGQPYSYFQWRFLSITGILILSSLIAQSQGLLFGAILMDRMKAAVFVAPAATTPIILFAGFLVRTQSIPHYLRPLSNLSYLRYAIEACLISRYGFNQCECDPAIFNQTVPELPPIARSMLDYWLSSFRPAPADPADAISLSSNSSSIILETITTTTTTTQAPNQENPDLFNKLISSLAKANSFGRNISSCEQVVPYPMIDYDLKDSQLFNCFAILISMLILTRLLTFFIVCFKVVRKV